MHDITQALLRQTTITSQIAEHLRAQPTNQDFAALLESVQRVIAMQQNLLDQNLMMMQLLRVSMEQREGVGKQPSIETQQHPTECPAWNPTSRSDA